VPVEKIKEFEDLFLTTLEQKHADVLEQFRLGKLSDETLKVVEDLATTLAKQFKA
jgi:F-type H+-transporting ATPase subunit alpha